MGVREAPPSTSKTRSVSGATRPRVVAGASMACVPLCSKHPDQLQRNALAQTRSSKLRMQRAEKMQKYLEPLVAQAKYLRAKKGLAAGTPSYLISGFHSVTICHWQTWTADFTLPANKSETSCIRSAAVPRVDIASSQRVSPGRFTAGSRWHSICRPPCGTPAQGISVCYVARCSTRSPCLTVPRAAI